MKAYFIQLYWFLEKMYAIRVHLLLLLFVQLQFVIVGQTLNYTNEVAQVQTLKNIEKQPAKKKKVVENFFKKATKSYKNQKKESAEESAKYALKYCSRYKTFNLLAIMRAEDKKPTIAAAYFDKAIEEAIKVSASLDTLHFNKAMLCLKNKQYETAFTELGKIKAIENFKNYWDYFGVVANHIGNKDDAIHAFRKSIDIGGGKFSTYFNLAVLLSEKGLDEEATSFFKKADGYRKKSLLVTLGFLSAKSIDYLSNKMLMSNITFNKLAVYENKNKIPILIAKGNLQLEQRDYKAALGTFKEVLRLDSTNTIVSLGLGNAYTGLGEYDKAMVFFENASQTKTTAFGAYMGLGYLQFQTKAYQTASESYLKCLAFMPQSPTAIEGKAIAAFYLNNSNTFFYYLAELKNIKKYKVSPFLITCQGVISANFGANERAIVLFKKALQKEPQNIAALNALSATYLNMKKNKLALFYLNKLVTIIPRDSFILSIYAGQLSKFGKLNRAIEAFDQLSATCPNNTMNDEIANEIALRLQAKKRYKEAKLYFNKAIAFDKKNPKWHTNLSMYYNELAKKTKRASKDSLVNLAFKELDIARSLGEAISNYIINKGVIYTTLGKYDTALLLFSRLSIESKTTNNNLGAVYAQQSNFRDSSLAKAYIATARKINEDERSKVFAEIQEIKNKEDALLTIISSQRRDKESIHQENEAPLWEQINYLRNIRKQLIVPKIYQEPITNQLLLSIDRQTNYHYTFCVHESTFPTTQMLPKPLFTPTLAFAPPKILIPTEIEFITYPTNEPCYGIKQPKKKKHQVRLKKQKKFKFYTGKCPSF